MNGLRLLVADDHALVRAGIRALLMHKFPGIEVIEAADGLEAVGLVERLQPGIVLMDISMPGMNGIETVRRLMQRQPATKIVMLSMHRDEDRILQAMRAGASGYLLKDVAVEEVARAIETVRNGGIYLSSGLPAVVKGLLATDERPDGPLGLLTGRQREILQLIAEGQSTKEIGYRLQLSTKTVESHRRMLMDRLEIFDVAGLARFAVRAGIVAADC